MTKTNHGTEQPSSSELEEMFVSSQINPDDDCDTPPRIIWVDDSTIATLGNFSASTGKAKSKKTFNVSAIVAASLSNGKVLQYRACLPDSKRRILYVDTEQGRFHCRNVVKRILRLAGRPDNVRCKDLVFLCLREYSHIQRIELIEYALSRESGVGLVIIDGIRDLMLDINSPAESVTLINRLMQWSSQYNLHIHCVLHLNKGDDNVRGHVGTELNNKAETVLVINRSRMESEISEVHPLNIRDKEFKPFAFKINEDGLPVNVSGYSFEAGATRNCKIVAADITDEQHLEVVATVFDTEVISGYENVISALSKGYAAIGFARGRTTMSKVLTLLLDKGFVVKRGNNDYYLPGRQPEQPSLAFTVEE